MTPLVTNKGSFSAKNNTPSLSNRFYSGVYGDYYTVSESGIIDFGTGSMSLDTGGIVVWNGSYFERYSGAYSLGLNDLVGPDYDAFLFYDTSSDLLAWTSQPFEDSIPFYDFSTSSISWMTAGDNLEISGTEIRHTTPLATGFSPSTTSDSLGANTFIKSVEVDANGHIKSVTTDILNNSLLNFSTNAGGGSVDLSAGESLNIVGGVLMGTTGDDGTNIITINHSVPADVSTGFVEVAGTFISGLTVDLYGHLTGIETQSIAAGNHITITKTVTTNTINHAAIGSTVTTHSATAGSYISSVSKDNYGHVVGIGETVLPNEDLNFSGDTGSGVIDLATETLNFSGGTAISTIVTGNQVEIKHSNVASTVATGDYLTSIVVNDQGHVTSVTAANFADLTGWTASDGTNTSGVDGGDTFTFVGGTGITTAMVNGINSVTIGLSSNNISQFTNDAGYLTSFSETDPIFTASAAYGITTSQIDNWDEAHGWGDHAGLYSLLGHTHTISEITDFPTNVSYFTNDAGYLTSASLTGYLPLTGGTLTGALTVNNALTTLRRASNIPLTLDRTTTTGLIFELHSDGVAKGKHRVNDTEYKVQSATGISLVLGTGTGEHLTINPSGKATFSDVMLVKGNEVRLGTGGAATDLTLASTISARPTNSQNHPFIYAATSGAEGQNGDLLIGARLSGANRDIHFYGSKDGSTDVTEMLVLQPTSGATFSDDLKIGDGLAASNRVLRINASTANQASIIFQKAGVAAWQFATNATANDLIFYNSVLGSNAIKAYAASNNVEIPVGTLTIGQYTLPNTLGSEDQVLAVPASGTTLEWTDVAIVGGSANQILLSDGSGGYSYITDAPASGEYLSYNGSSFVWNSITESGTINYGADTEVAFMDGTDGLQYKSRFTFTFDPSGLGNAIGYDRSYLSVPIIQLVNSETTDITAPYQLAFDANDSGAPTRLGTYAGAHPMGIYVSGDNASFSSVGNGIVKVWHTGLFGQTEVENWEIAYNDHVTSAAFSAGTLTFTQKDGGTFAATGDLGTVASVGLSAPTGFAVSSSPITTAGTISLTFATGYSLPTTASQTNWTTAYNHSQITTGNPHDLGYADISDFNTGVSAYETSHSDVVVDGDFISNGLMKRTAAGVYAIITDDSTNWTTAYNRSITSVSWNPAAGDFNFVVQSGTLGPVNLDGRYTKVTTGTVDRVAFFDGAFSLNSGDLYWDSATSRLGIGISPTYKLDVNGSAGFNDYIYHNGDSDTYFLLETNSIKTVSGLTINFQGTSTLTSINPQNTLDLSINNGLVYVDQSASTVGINTLTPNSSYTFHANGSSLISGDLTVDSTGLESIIIQSKSTTGESIIRFKDSTNTVNQAYLGFPTTAANLYLLNQLSGELWMGTNSGVQLKLTTTHLQNTTGAYTGASAGDYMQITADYTSFYQDEEEEMRIDTSGILYVRSNILGYASVITSSDARLKNIIDPYDHYLSKESQGEMFDSMMGKRWKWRADSGRSGESSGLIAQEVREYMPWLVTEQENAFNGNIELSLNYQGLFMPVFNEIGLVRGRLTELETKEEALERRVTDLEQENRRLRDELSQL